MSINYQETVLIAAFVRQAALSLDRARWTGLDELQEYYARQKLNPTHIPSLLNEYCINIPLTNNDNDTPKELNLFEKFIFYIKRSLSLTDLPMKQWCLLKIKLSELDFILNISDTDASSNQVSNKKLIYSKQTHDLSIWFSHFYFNKLSPVLRKREYQETTYVEHFNQSENPLLKPVEYFIRATRIDFTK